MILVILFSLILNFAFAQNPINIIYTNDLEGSVATCGCATDPGGGVVRAMNWYKKSAFSPSDTIYINSGSTLFSGSAYASYEVKTIKLGAVIMADFLSAMNLDAYTPGENDSKLGLDFFTATTKKLPILITNSSDKKILKEINIKRAGYDITILGVSSNKKFSVSDPVKALKDAVKKNKKKGGVMILLADVDEKTLNTIAKQVSDIDVILSSGIQEQLTEPLAIKDSVVVRLLEGGDSVGLLKYHPEKKKEEKFDNQIIYLGSAYDKENAFSARVKKYEELQKTAAPRLKN